MGMPSRVRRSAITKIQGKGLLVRGLNVLAATISTPLAAPVIAATRLRGGNASSARGAASHGHRSGGHCPRSRVRRHVVVRMDSAFYGAPAVWAARAAGAYFSVTVRIDPKVRAAIAAIGDDAWTPIRYPRAIWDDQLRLLDLRRRGRGGGIHRVHLAARARPSPPG